jgi:hypothetical protein
MGGGWIRAGSEANDGNIPTANAQQQNDSPGNRLFGMFDPKVHIRLSV